MKKKVVSLCLALTMAGSLMAGCGNTEESAATSADSATEAAATETEAAEEEFDESSIVVALLSFAPLDSSATDAIEEKINELTQADLNMTVDLQWYDAGSYSTQIPMMIQAGDTLDLFLYVPNGGTTFSSLMNANQLMDISEYLDEYGETITDALGDLILGTSRGDAIYGVTNNFCMSGQESILMRKDILDQLGLTEQAEAADSWSDIEAIYKEVAANTDLSPVINSDTEGTVANPRPFVNNADSFSDCYYADTLGDSAQMLMVDEETNTISCYYTSDEYKETCERLHNWYEEGLIYKDATTSQDYSDTLIKNGIGFSRVSLCELGTLESSEATTGYEEIEVPITSSEITTASVGKFGFAVPVTSKEPESAVRFLNYIYGSEEASNTLAWGLEGRDWVLGDDGLATYPDGVTADTVMYHIGDFLFGNQQMITPWEGNDPDLRQQQAEATASTPVSKYMGFSCDSEGLETQVTACQNVVAQYHPQLDAGCAEDWEATFDEMCSKLEAAGINELIAAYQEQLDAWLAEQ